MKNMTKEYDDLKCLEVKLKETLKKVEANAKNPALSESSLKQSLKATIISKKNLKDDLSVYKEDLMDTSYQCFE